MIMVTAMTVMHKKVHWKAAKEKCEWQIWNKMLPMINHKI